MTLTSESVMVDTSVWISAFRGKSGDVVKITRQLLNNDRVLTCGPVLFEIRRGMRESERKRTMSLMEAMIRLPFGESDWDRAGELDGLLRSQGITLPPMDVLIARICLHHKVPLFSLDRHFESVPNLKLFLP